ncbi:hypothetical protein PG994_012658 [Apiospora phragmitis]|uniref:Uncharacterized protein n=1 Tax=Apiospora phragmitis TaxID=2905665 RepID=A0ABR1TCY9_9PEZI
MEMDWELEMCRVLDMQAAGPNQTIAMLPLQWKSGWRPAIVQALLKEATQATVPGKLPQLQFSVPGALVWQDYDLTLEKVLTGNGTPPTTVPTQERVLAYKCFEFVKIWCARRAALYAAHQEALFRATFSDEKVEALRVCETVAQLRAVIDGLVDEEL